MAENVDAVLSELAVLGTEQTKKNYKSQGVVEPFFGVPTGAMKPLAKKHKKDHALAMALYDTGNYDAMYLAGMIADPKRMTEAEIEHWMAGAYCNPLCDYVVSVTLAETDFAQAVADRWIDDDRELYQSAGWSCYTWLLGVKPDDAFDTEKLRGMLERVEANVHTAPKRARNAMNGFLTAVGISYLPLHAEALRVAQAVGVIEADVGTTGRKVPLASVSIQKAADAGRLGFKRRNVRC